MFELMVNLISTLTKRLCSETHTFYLPCGECTITLEDVALQLGLLVENNALTCSSKVLEPTTLCYQLLGHSPGDGEASRAIKCDNCLHAVIVYKFHLGIFPRI
ncbi:hypothetical protein PVK06_009793 [Gossypium arboreum]|uniref:Aminotransferase-like plant mobile domain-containing protein n=1 Tax=Gossypium arboreum TaxID=29729 RepID=A0ABR0QPJ3_GOSAR|nr:hypothetical protein PVK06_009793 [Gossypium arboreum]